MHCVRTTQPSNGDHSTSSLQHRRPCTQGHDRTAWCTLLCRPLLPRRKQTTRSKSHYPTGTRPHRQLPTCNLPRNPYFSISLPVPWTWSSLPIFTSVQVATGRLPDRNAITPRDGHEKIKPISLHLYQPIYVSLIRLLTTSLTASSLGRMKTHPTRRPPSLTITISGSIASTEMDRILGWGVFLAILLVRARGVETPPLLAIARLYEARLCAGLSGLHSRSLATAADIHGLLSS